MKKLELICKKCGWTWIPRSEKKPRVCPRCKRYNYEEPKGIK